MTATAFQVFGECYRAMRAGKLVSRVSSQDKEFHFQNWVQARLDALDLPYERRGRNSYPDFVLVDRPEGFEVKGLAFPGREQDYDANSQVPFGFHSGREIYYIFGRYPDKAPDQYEVLDLVVCHGDFLNADREYVHKNRHLRGFGSYGDIMIRDRKMYVVPTPIALTTGTEGHATLIAPASETPAAGFVAIGDLVRTETDHVVVGYRFDLTLNVLTPELAPNAHAGQQHRFTAYRSEDDFDRPVALKPLGDVIQEQMQLADQDEEESEQPQGQ